MMWSQRSVKNFLLKSRKNFVRSTMEMSGFSLTSSSSWRGLSTNAQMELHKIRNLGIVAHIDAGKTTTSEHMLYLSGLTKGAGRVDNGDTLLDFLSQERERGITIASAAVSLPWKGHTINLIDTPGHVDFSMEVEASARILDGAVLLLDAVSGVQAQTRAVWRRISKRGLPAIAFVNKMDRMGADLFQAVDSLRNELKTNPALLQIPYCNPDSNEFEGIVDLLTLQVFAWPTEPPSSNVKYSSTSRPPDPIVFQLTESDTQCSDPVFGHSNRQEYHNQLWQEAQEARRALFDDISSVDEQFMELCLETDYAEITPRDIVPALRRACIARELVPVLCGASLRGKGVPALMDSALTFLPCPTEARPVLMVSASKDVRPLPGSSGNTSNLLSGTVGLASGLQYEGANDDSDEPTETKTLPPAGDEFCALVFKVVNDAMRGPLAYARIFGGELSKNTSLFNSTANRAERSPTLLASPVGSELQSLAVAHRGQVVCIGGLRGTMSGDTLVSSNSPLKKFRMEGMDVPRPVFAQSIEPASNGQEKALHQALLAIAMEDPSFQIEYDEESGQTIIRGLGELHLEVIVDRLKRDFKVDVITGRAYIAYRQDLIYPIARKSGATYTSGPIPESKGFTFSLPAAVTPAPELLNNLSVTFTGEVKCPITGQAKYDRTIEGRHFFAKFDVEVWPADVAQYLPNFSKKNNSKKNVVVDELEEPEKLSSVGIVDSRFEIDPVLASMLGQEGRFALEDALRNALGRGPRGYPTVNLFVRVKPTADTVPGEKVPLPGAVRASIATFISSILNDQRTLSYQEPVMNVEVETPEEHMGTILADLSGQRRAENISIREVSNGHSAIIAEVPFNCLLGYASELRSLTQGNANFCSTFSHYRPVSPDLAAL